MIIFVNGVSQQVEPGIGLLDVLSADLQEPDGSGPRRGVAVALNGGVVLRTEISASRLAEGDRIEIVTAVQGG